MDIAPSLPSVVALRATIPDDAFTADVDSVSRRHADAQAGVAENVTVSELAIVDCATPPELQTSAT